MHNDPWRWLPINDDVDAEFHFWKDELLASLRLALLFAVATGALIGLWPAGDGRQQGLAFARDYWTYLVEAAFWLGYLIGLLWGAGKRLGAALAGSLPWAPPRADGGREATARFFGQWAAFFVLAGGLVYLARGLLAVVEPKLLAFGGALAPVQLAAFLTAAVFTLFALLARRRPQGQASQKPRRSD